MATLNELAPGRVIFGIGTGFSARNVMGMPARPLSVLKDDVAVFRKLTTGDEATYREGERVREIRFLHPEMGFINVRDPIPVYVAANAPKAIKAVGELNAEGWIAVANDPGFVRDGIKGIKAAGGSGGSLDTVALVGACVLRPGEKADVAAGRRSDGLVGDARAPHHLEPGGDSGRSLRSAVAV